MKEGVIMGDKETVEQVYIPLRPRRSSPIPYEWVGTGPNDPPAYTIPGHTTLTLNDLR